DAYWHGSVVDDERRPVANIPVPQGSRTLGLPAKTCLAALAIHRRSTDEATLGKHPAHGALGHVVADASVGAQRAHDDRDAHVGVLAPDVAEQLAQCRVEVASTSAISPGLRHERREATAFEVVEPALQRRNRVAARQVATRRTDALLAQ